MAVVVSTEHCHQSYSIKTFPDSSGCLIKIPHEWPINIITGVAGVPLRYDWPLFGAAGWLEEKKDLGITMAMQNSGDFPNMVLISPNYVSSAEIIELGDEHPTVNKM